MTREQLRAKILETIKGYEPVAKGDGTPIGYDLDKDGRTEFGFYWEFEDMEDCADAIMALLDEVETALLDRVLVEVIGKYTTEVTPKDEIDMRACMYNDLRAEQVTVLDRIKQLNSEEK